MSGELVGQPAGAAASLTVITAVIVVATLVIRYPRFRAAALLVISMVNVVCRPMSTPVVVRVARSSALTLSHPSLDYGSVPVGNGTRPQGPPLPGRRVSPLPGRRVVTGSAGCTGIGVDDSRGLKSRKAFTLDGLAPRVPPVPELSVSVSEPGETYREIGPSRLNEVSPSPGGTDPAVEPDPSVPCAPIPSAADGCPLGPGATSPSVEERPPHRNSHRRRPDPEPPPHGTVFPAG